MGSPYTGNDWITDDDAPRPVRVLDLRAAGEDKIDVILGTLDGKEVIQTLGFDTQPPEKPTTGTVNVIDGKVKLSLEGDAHDFPLRADETAIDAALGAPDRLWVIVRTAAGTEVRAYTLGGEFLRRLAYAAIDPTPRRIFAAHGKFAARWSEQILRTRAK